MASMYHLEIIIWSLCDQEENPCVYLLSLSAPPVQKTFLRQHILFKAWTQQNMSKMASFSEESTQNAHLFGITYAIFIFSWIRHIYRD